MVENLQGAGNLGYECGYTYLTGGRTPLDYEEQQLLARNLAQGCCETEEMTQMFVASFISGYAARVTREKTTQLVMTIFHQLQKELGRKPTMLELAEQCQLDPIDLEALKISFRWEK